MDISAADSNVGEVPLEFLCHSFGEGGHQYSLVHFLPLSDLFKQVVDLVLCRSYLYRRVEKSGRTYDLFHYESLRFLQLIIRWSCADIHSLTGDAFELVELQWPVVSGCRQAESIIHEN